MVSIVGGITGGTALTGPIANLNIDAHTVTNLGMDCSIVERQMPAETLSMIGVEVTIMKDGDQGALQGGIHLLGEAEALVKKMTENRKEEECNGNFNIVVRAGIYSV